MHGLTIAEIARLQPRGAQASTPRVPVPRRDRSGEPLHLIDPPAYVWLLTGQQVGRTGKIVCPLPGHDDGDHDGGSFHAYPDAKDGWFCFGCRRGGDVFTLAQALWPELGFPEVKRRLVELVTAGSARAA